MSFFSHWCRSFACAAATSSRSSWDPLVSLTLRLPTLVLLEKCRTREQFKQILAQMIRIHLTSQTFPMSRILHFSTVTNPGNIDMAIVLFYHFMTEPNLFIYNTMISALSSSKESLCIYKSMLCSSLIPDRQTLLSLLKASKCLSEGKQIHGHAIITGFSSHTYLQNSLIKMYLENGQTSLAHQVFNQMPAPDSVSWNIMIYGYSKNGWSLKALELFCEMANSGLKLDEFTMVSLLVACGKLGDLRRGKSIHTWIERRKLNSSSNLIVGNALLDFYVKHEKLELACHVFGALGEKDIISWNTMIAGYAKIGELELASKFFLEMPWRDLVSWNSLITGYSQNGNIKAARGLFIDMILVNVRPDMVTIISFISSAAATGDLNQGKWIHGWVVKTQLKLDPVVGSALIDMYSKCGCIERALIVFDRIHERDVAVWTAMIAGLAFHGCGSKALEIFAKMKKNLMPNSVTFVAILTACSHSGMVNQGYQIFNSMQQNFGIDAGIEHYGCLVDLLARSGRLMEVKNVIDNMPMRPSAAIWGSVLSACKTRGDIELAETALRELLKLEPEKDGGYVHMANLYSSSGRWGYSDKIRETMDDKGVKKIAGCSQVVIDGIVNEFIAGDKRHFRWVEIYRILDELLKEMRYVEDIRGQNHSLFS